jgi:hypothetical protein
MNSATSRSTHRIHYAAAATVLAWAAHIFFRRDFEPGDSIRLAATTIVILCFLWLILEQVRFLRNQDEFVRQVQCLALAIAFPATMVLLLTFGFFRAEGVSLLQGGDPRDLPMIPMLTYAIGLTIALKHYG